MLVSARALTVLVIAHNDAQNLLATIERIYSALTVTRGVPHRRHRSRRDAGMREISLRPCAPK